jgi:hypothetical protein
LVQEGRSAEAVQAGIPWFRLTTDPHAAPLSQLQPLMYSSPDIANNRSARQT